ncbi:glutathione S-transferase-like [Pseudoalteromonas luteoviolacea B = ATCC 29581]|nr:glutathione S-transferase-like [Pseudoalteromonas luteoviolacea B = ATCC 29581]
MSKPKVTYFDVNGGRAEPIRLAFFIGGIEFEDDRFPYADFAEVKKRTPLGQVPTLEMDGQIITQSNAITSYVGKLAGLYPNDDFQALLCEEIMCSIEDVTTRIVGTFGLDGEALKTAREKLLNDYLIPHLKWLESKLSGNDYFIESRLTVADLKVMAHLGWMQSGMLEHIPNTAIAQHTPALNTYFSKLRQHPKITEYYQNH